MRKKGSKSTVVKMVFHRSCRSLMTLVESSLVSSAAKGLSTQRRFGCMGEGLQSRSIFPSLVGYGGASAVKRCGQLCLEARCWHGAPMKVTFPESPTVPSAKSSPVFSAQTSRHSLHFAAHSPGYAMRGRGRQLTHAQRSTV
ncbi:unnamed protein product [Spirodela intermedia]|uniref:Uncharacterized protein n=1 Tax=Spirodela intermedia TaxID=51605 RepID=A0A7I8KNF8_SPIIN|nr:unnamed protein product [Spirodela intermedia]